jgi:GNAT superfamily N-acetyltransferase
VNDLERIEAAALRDAVLLAGGRAELVGGALCVAHEGIAIRELNRAMPLGDAVDLDAIAAWFGAAEHMVATTLRIDGRGYTCGAPWQKFERGAEPAPEAATELEVAETVDGESFGLVAAEGSGLPPETGPALAAIVGAPGWHCFLAAADGEPAAAGALYVDGTGAWLGIGATRPAFRRRGAQSALLAARIERARALGAGLLTTETGADDPGPSFRNIERAGFRPAYVRPNWLSPA